MKKPISYLVQIGGKILETDPCLVICQSKEGTLGDATVWVDDYFVVGGKNFVKFVQEKIQEEFTVRRIANHILQHQRDYIKDEYRFVTGKISWLANS